MCLNCPLSHTRSLWRREKWLVCRGIMGRVFSSLFEILYLSSGLDGFNQDVRERPNVTGFDSSRSMISFATLLSARVLAIIAYALQCKPISSSAGIGRFGKRERAATVGTGSCPDPCSHASRPAWFLLQLSEVRQPEISWELGAGELGELRELGQLLIVRP